MLGPLMIGISGYVLSEKEKAWLLNPWVGGVILFSRNFKDCAQLQRLNASIRAVRDTLLIAVDQEGGRVQRFQEGFTRLPSLSSLGEQYDQMKAEGLAAARDSAKQMATELKSCGVDFSFAPVLDLRDDDSQVIGCRAFHANPESVIALARAYCQGMHAAGMPTVGKHFPGHGGVIEDSHVACPVDHRSFSEISVMDLLPFQAMIKEGLLSAVMMNHVSYPQVDECTAGVSSYWIRWVLREQLGFQGVIFSDDLGMAGAGKDVASVRVQRALTAGCDMVLLCNEPEDIEQTLKACEQWVWDQLRAERLMKLHAVASFAKEQTFA